MIENKKYFIDQINSSKANQFICAYHYSHVGFKRAKINLGIFLKENNQLVGVLQWGQSYTKNIKLDRYVKESININEYLELNRFAMADSEDKNAESQAISLGLKWIKRNCPEIKLLVSYSGRKEGNYGYIYQATNWEYLGYFVSPGFWILDGEEKHLTTLWYHHSKYHNGKGFIEDLLDRYSSVVQTWTKQFIYIIRLDKSLTPASPPLEYPKPSSEYPIKVKEKIYKQGLNEKIKEKQITAPVFYWVQGEQLFSKQALLRRQGYAPKKKKEYQYAQYDLYGNLDKKGLCIKDFENDILNYGQLVKAFKDERFYKDKYFKKFELDEEVPEQIDVPIVAIIDEIPFPKEAEMARYLGISRQAVNQSKQRRAKKIAGKDIIWMI